MHRDSSASLVKLKVQNQKHQITETGGDGWDLGYQKHFFSYLFPNFSYFIFQERKIIKSF